MFSSSFSSGSIPQRSLFHFLTVFTVFLLLSSAHASFATVEPTLSLLPDNTVFAVRIKDSLKIMDNIIPVLRGLDEDSKGIEDEIAMQLRMVQAMATMYTEFTAVSFDGEMVFSLSVHAGNDPYSSFTGKAVALPRLLPLVILPVNNIRTFVDFLSSDSIGYMTVSVTNRTTATNTTTVSLHSDGTTIRDPVSTRTMTSFVLHHPIDGQMMLSEWAEGKVAITMGPPATLDILYSSSSLTSSVLEPLSIGRFVQVARSATRTGWLPAVIYAIHEPTHPGIGITVDVNISSTRTLTNIPLSMLRDPYRSVVKSDSLFGTTTSFATNRDDKPDSYEAGSTVEVYHRYRGTYELATIMYYRPYYDEYCVAYEDSSFESAVSSSRIIYAFTPPSLYARNPWGSIIDSIPVKLRSSKLVDISLPPTRTLVIPTSETNGLTENPFFTYFRITPIFTVIDPLLSISHSLIPYAKMTIASFISVPAELEEAAGIYIEESMEFFLTFIQDIDSLSYGIGPLGRGINVKASLVFKPNSYYANLTKLLPNTDTDLLQYLPADIPYLSVTGDHTSMDIVNTMNQNYFRPIYEKIGNETALSRLLQSIIGDILAFPSSLDGSVIATVDNKYTAPGYDVAISPGVFIFVDGDGNTLKNQCLHRVRALEASFEPLLEVLAGQDTTPSLFLGGTESSSTGLVPQKNEGAIIVTNNAETGITYATTDDKVRVHITPHFNRTIAGVVFERSLINVTSVLAPFATLVFEYNVGVITETNQLVVYALLDDETVSKFIRTAIAKGTDKDNLPEYSQLPRIRRVTEALPKSKQAVSLIDLGVVYQYACGYARKLLGKSTIIYPGIEACSNEFMKFFPATPLAASFMTSEDAFRWDIFIEPPEAGLVNLARAAFEE